MDVSWCFHCDLLVEELNPRTNARIAQWTIKNTRIVLGDEAVSWRSGALPWDTRSHGRDVSLNHCSLLLRVVDPHPRFCMRRAQNPAFCTCRDTASAFKSR